MFVCLFVCLFVATIGRPAPVVFVGDNGVPSSAMVTNTTYVSPSHRTQQQQQQQQQPQQQESDTFSPLLVSPNHRMQQQSDTYSHLTAHHQQQQQQQQIPMQIAAESIRGASPQQQPYSGTFSYLSGYQDVQMTEQARYSPSSFLSMTHGQEKRGEDRPLLDIQQAGNFALKCEPTVETIEVCSSRDSRFYQNMGVPGGGFNQMQVEMGRGGGREERGSSTPEEHYRRQQQQKMLSDGALESVLDQFYQSEQHDPLLNAPSAAAVPGRRQPMQTLGEGFQYPPGAGSPLTSPPPPVTNRAAAAREPPFVRVSSAGNLPLSADLTMTPARPPLERGKSEPIKHLQDKVRSLNVQHMKQMEELDKQKTIAEVQYSELLMQLMPQAAKPDPTMAPRVKPEPSDQQQQVLQRVLSDPSLVKILRSMLLPGSQKQAAASTSSPPLIAPAPPHLQRGSATPPHLQPRGSASATPPPTQGQLFGQPQVTSPLLSPTELAMVSLIWRKTEVVCYLWFLSLSLLVLSFLSPLSSLSPLSASSLPPCLFPLSSSLPAASLPAPASSLPASSLPAASLNPLPPLPLPSLPLPSLPLPSILFPPSSSKQE